MSEATAVTIVADGGEATASNPPLQVTVWEPDGDGGWQPGGGGGGGAVATVNSVEPDEDGNVELDLPDLGLPALSMGKWPVEIIPPITVGMLAFDPETQAEFDAALATINAAIATAGAFKGPFSIANTYAAGEVVNYAGSLYRAKGAVAPATSVTYIGGAISARLINTPAVLAFPAGTQAGDVGIVAAFNRYPPQPSTGPTGWAEVSGARYDPGGSDSDGTLFVYAKVLTQADVTAGSVSQPSSGTSLGHAAALRVYRGSPIPTVSRVERVAGYGAGNYQALAPADALGAGERALAIVGLRGTPNGGVGISWLAGTSNPQAGGAGDWPAALGLADVTAGDPPTFTIATGGATTALRAVLKLGSGGFNASQWERIVRGSEQEDASFRGPWVAQAYGKGDTVSHTDGRVYRATRAAGASEDPSTDPRIPPASGNGSVSAMKAYMGKGTTISGASAGGYRIEVLTAGTLVIDCPYGFTSIYYGHQLYKGTSTAEIGGTVAPSTTKTYDVTPGTYYLNRYSNGTVIQATISTAGTAAVADPPTMAWQRIAAAPEVADRKPYARGAWASRPYARGDIATLNGIAYEALRYSWGEQPDTASLPGTTPTVAAEAGTRQWGDYPTLAPGVSQQVYKYEFLTAGVLSITAPGGSMGITVLGSTGTQITSWYSSNTERTLNVPVAAGIYFLRVADLGEWAISGPPLKPPAWQPIGAADSLGLRVAAIEARKMRGAWTGQAYAFGDSVSFTDGKVYEALRATTAAEAPGGAPPTWLDMPLTPVETATFATGPAVSQQASAAFMASGVVTAMGLQSYPTIRVAVYKVLPTATGSITVTAAAGTYAGFGNAAGASLGTPVNGNSRSFNVTANVPFYIVALKGSTDATAVPVGQLTLSGIAITTPEPWSAPIAAAPEVAGRLTAAQRTAINALDAGTATVADVVNALKAV